MNKRSKSIHDDFIDKDEIEFNNKNFTDKGKNELEKNSDRKVQ